MFDLLLVITLLWKGVMLTIKVKYRDIETLLRSVRILMGKECKREEFV